VAFSGKGHHRHKYPVGHKAHSVRTVSGVPLVALLAPAHESDQALIFPLVEELVSRYPFLSFSYMILERGYDIEEIHHDLYEFYAIIPIIIRKRPLKNPSIFTILKKMMDFFEVTGGRVLSFRNVSVGEPAGNPGASELKKSPSSLDQQGLCKGLRKKMVYSKGFTHDGYSLCHWGFPMKPRRIEYRQRRTLYACFKLCTQSGQPFLFSCQYVIKERYKFDFTCRTYFEDGYRKYGPAVPHSLIYKKRKPFPALRGPLTLSKKIDTAWK